MAQTFDDAERRQLTVMFCDLVGSTQLATQLDPEDLREFNRAYRDFCTGIIQRYDGYVARFMGDGILAYFGYPRAHEDDAARALYAGIAMITHVGQGVPYGDNMTAPALRIGISTGSVVVGELIGEGLARERDVVGETPNLAARLQALAQPNTVVVSDSTRKLVGAAFQLEDLGPQNLKGFVAPMGAWRILGSASPTTRFEATGQHTLTPFIGRDHETNLIKDCWRISLESIGQVVLLVGEPGIGKSRIMMTLRQHARDDECEELRLQCSPYHQNSALYPVVEHLLRAAGIAENDTPTIMVEKLRHLVGPREESGHDLALFATMLSIHGVSDMAPLDLEPEVLRERTLEALARYLATTARQQPLLMLVEDIHWADPTTLELLGLLVERVATWKAMLMITFRPEFDPPWTGEAHVSLLSLNRLTRHQCEAIVRNLATGKSIADDIVEQIISKTDGVPLFVEEFTRAMLESGIQAGERGSHESSGQARPLTIPATLKDSLMARLDHLAGAKTLAQIGAAIGREFPRSLLLEICELDEETLDASMARLTHSGLVFQRGTGDRARFVFKHALIQDAAYDSMLKSRRRDLHCRIAQIMEGMPDIVRTGPEILAHHFTCAESSELALPYWLEAARRAKERSAFREAISHFRQGLECCGSLAENPSNATRMVELRIAIAECLRIVDRMDDAFEILEEAEVIAKRFSFSRLLARIYYQRGNLYFPMARTEQCLAAHGRALDFAHAAGSISDEASALGGLGDAYYVSGRMRTARHYFSQCVELARRHNLDQTAAANLSMVGFSRLYMLELRQSLQDGLESVALAVASGNPRAELMGHIMQLKSNYYMARYDEAISSWELADRVTARLGARRFQPQNDYYRAMVLYNLGDKDQAIAILDEAESLARATSVEFSLVMVLGGVVLTTDDAERRERVLDQAQQLLDAGVVAHNYFAFYGAVVDSCFDHGEWDRMDMYADRLSDYTRAEPLPLAEFIATRAHALAAWGRGQRGPSTISALQGLLKTAREAEFNHPLRKIELSLSQA